jgi:hypothetical protein
MKPHWNEVIGKSGYVKIKHRTYKTKDGEERTTNDVDSYIHPDDWDKVVGAQQPAPAQPAAQPVAAPQQQQTQMPMPAQPQQYQNPYSMD